MNHFPWGRAILPAAGLVVLAVPLAAAAQTQEDCRALADGIQAGAAAAQKITDQVAPLGRGKVQVTALSLLLSNEKKRAGETMDEKMYRPR
jgi:hypothetical protein